MEPIVQQPYNLFAQQKQKYYPTSQNQQQTPVQTIVQQPVQTAGGQTAKDVVRTEREAGRKVWGDQGTGTLGEYNNQKPITSMDDLARAMGYTSPQEEERMRKASVANQRILALGDALRHIGNIYHTVNYAPSQQFNNPVQEERQRYLQSKAIRDKANLTYMNYMQAKAAQDQKMRQWAAQQALAERDYQFKVDKDKRDAAEAKRRNDAYISNYANIMANRDNTFQHKVDTDKRRLDISQQNADTSRMRANKIGQGKTGSGYTTVTTKKKTYDANGKENGYQTTTQKTVGGKTTTTSKGKAYGNKEQKQGKGRGY